jgi:hypothetical protein
MKITRPPVGCDNNDKFGSSGMPLLARAPCTTTCTVPDGCCGWLSACNQHYHQHALTTTVLLYHDLFVSIGRDPAGHSLSLNY